MTVGYTLEQQPEQPHPEDKDEDVVQEELPDEVMHEVSSLHHLLTALTVTSWYRGQQPPLNSTDHLTPLITCYKMAARVTANTQAMMSE